MNFETKQDYLDFTLKILNPIKEHYSTGCARLDLGDFGVTYFKGGIELEGFSRPLWALGPVWTDKNLETGFEEIYLKGLANGTNPASPEYWGGFDDYDQRFVEMAAIANMMILAPDKIWDKMNESEQANLAKWLYGINEHAIPDCNWQFFMILVNIALKKLGLRYSEERLQDGLDKIESYYIGDGWYQDGSSCQKDYYISYAIHYYGLLYSVFMAKEDPERCARFKERAEIFAKEFIYWFADDGAALPFGRSLTYKWAQNSFWSACIYAGIKPFSLEIMKGVLSRNFAWWEKQKVFHKDGLLAVGYSYPNLIMSERYNSPCSSYWSMKSFLVLALPNDHEFWKVKAAPLPELETTKPLYKADMIMQRFPNDSVALTAGVCEMYGHGHVPEKYSKFAYSTKYGFSCPRSLRVDFEAAPDSMLAFIIDDYVFVRKNSTKYEVFADKIVSSWCPFKGINVVTTLIPTNTGHIRRHEVESEFDCIANDYGFSVPSFDYHDTKTNTAENSASATNADFYCKVSSESAHIKADVLLANPNTNVMFTNTRIPYVSYKISKGKTVFETTITTKE